MPKQTQIVYRQLHLRKSPQFQTYNKSKWHTRTPTHGLASTLDMNTAISCFQRQPWTAVSALLGFIRMHSRRAENKTV